MPKSNPKPDTSTPKPVRCPECGHLHDPDEPHEEHPEGAARHLDAISDHVEHHIGAIEMVYHERKSREVHIDVLHVAPSDKWPFHMLVTSGMSDAPMNVPDDDLRDGVSRHAELYCILPPDWRLDMDAFREDNRWYWPLATLKLMAVFPHIAQTYLAQGHTVPNIDHPDPFDPSVGFNCALIARGPLPPEGFHHLQLDDKRIDFFALVPLYEEETQFKLKHGTDDLLDLFYEYDVVDLIEPGRVNVVVQMLKDQSKSAGKKAVKKAATKAVKRPAARKVAAQKAAKPATKKATAKKPVAGKAAVKKATPKKAVAKKATAKKAASKKTAAKKVAVKKAAKPVAKKPGAKKAVVKKVAVKKPTTKKTAAKKKSRRT